MKEVKFELPIFKTVSESNVKEHYRISGARHRWQQKRIKGILMSKKEAACVKLPCTVKLTRISPRKLDSDNLTMAFKWIRDEIADFLIPGLKKGRADSDSRIEWEYAQEKSKTSETGIKIEFVEKVNLPPASNNCVVNQ